MAVLLLKTNGEIMKILHVLTSHIFSGAENVVCQIIGMLKDEPNVEMAYCSPDGTIRPALEERDINFLPIEVANTSEIKRISDEKSSISIAENLIKLKGIDDVVILLNKGSVNIIASGDTLDDSKIAQIQNIVQNELGVEVKNIHINHV